MTISWGYVFSSEKEWDNIYDIAKEADERMYKNKERYYQEANSQTKVTDCVFLYFQIF